MIRKTIDTSKLKLAKIKIYDAEGKGSYHFPEGVEEPYAFLYEVNGTFVNIFNPLADLPVCERTHYAFCNKEGEDIGCYVTHVQGELTDGPYYVMNPRDCRSVIFSDDEIEMERLKQYVLRSGHFFLERLDIIKSLPIMEKRKYRKIAREDQERHDKFNKLVTASEKGYQYYKENR